MTPVVVAQRGPEERAPVRRVGDGLGGGRCRARRDAASATIGTSDVAVCEPTGPTRALAPWLTRSSTSPVAGVCRFDLRPDDPVRTTEHAAGPFDVLDGQGQPALLVTDPTSSSRRPTPGAMNPRASAAGPTSWAGRCLATLRGRGGRRRVAPPSVVVTVGLVFELVRSSSSSSPETLLLRARGHRDDPAAGARSWVAMSPAARVGYPASQSMP